MRVITRHGALVITGSSLVGGRGFLDGGVVRRVGVAPVASDAPDVVAGVPMFVGANAPFDGGIMYGYGQGRMSDCG